MSRPVRSALLCPALFALVVAACGGGECVVDGHSYEAGDTFDIDCNGCSCQSDGTIVCTQKACDTCADVTSRYAEAMAEAKQCDPEQADPCSKLLVEGLACACETFVNPEQTEAIDAAEGAQSVYRGMACGGDVVCGPCLAPVSGYCSTAGRCEPVYAAGAEAGCKVNGVVYESGASGIPDPVSCNTCQCSDGQLSCTEINCPTECPPNRKYGTQCAQCGPTDDCEIVEHGCLLVCDGETCNAGACVDNTCKTLCG